MGILSLFSGVLAPLFIILSPITSYGDQILSIQRNKTSAGFSLDIPLIMLVASIFRVFYYPGAKYDISLLIQSLLMIVMQVLLLKVALDHRPSPSRGGDLSTPFAAHRDGYSGFQRPYNFWQWRSHKPYWHFLLYLFITLMALELLISPMQSLYAPYSKLVGYIGLSIEATLPLPQIFANARSRSCKGFRLSVLASWIGGDLMKMFWFFTATTEIPLAFKMCGIFQMFCDMFLGGQYFVFGSGPPSSGPGMMKEHLSPAVELGAIRGDPGTFGFPNGLDMGRKPSGLELDPK